MVTDGSYSITYTVVQSLYDTPDANVTLRVNSSLWKILTCCRIYFTTMKHALLALNFFDFLLSFWNVLAFFKFLYKCQLLVKHPRWPPNSGKTNLLILYPVYTHHHMYLYYITDHITAKWALQSWFLIVNTMRNYFRECIIYIKCEKESLNTFAFHNSNRSTINHFFNTQFYLYNKSIKVVDSHTLL